MNYERLVELKRWKGVGFGFSVIGGSDTHIPPMICALVRDSPALLSKQVFVGDVLYKVNGISVANLETKEVVDLIRNCEEFIVLSLKEDRLAKLKARPFLAEDTLIEPPRSAGNVYADSKQQQQQQQQQQHLNHPKSTHPQHTGPGGPKQYGREEHFIRRSGSNPFTSQQPKETLSLDRINNRNRDEKHNAVPNNGVSSTLTYDNHLNRLLRLPGRNVTNSMPSSNTTNTASTNQFTSDYTTTNMSNSISDSVVPFHNDVTTVSRCQTSRPSSGQSLTKSNSSDYDVYNMSNMLDFGERSSSVPYSRKSSGSHGEHRRHSNPAEDREFPKSESDSSIVPYDIACDTQYDVSKFPTSQNNYSSPNIYNDSDVFTEHKSLTLMPTTQSQYSLNKNFFNNDINNSSKSSSSNHRHLTPPTSAVVSHVRSPTSSSLSSSQVESTGVPSTSSLDEVSPADIASRLFSLNGYKDDDVAPILGKNTQFSQQVCREYLRFFNFDGLSLDDALRLFLKKFPLTGETQEQERILVHYSKRYYECNKNPDMSEDALHTLTCALMLLNADLHRHGGRAMLETIGITNKMSLNDFVNNLAGLCDGKDFSKEYLKTLYNAIKSKEIIFAANSRSDSITPKSNRKNSAPGNPFVELKTDSKDLVLCEGLLYRKSVMDPGGRRTPAMRRNWRPCYCVLKGLVLYSYKPDNTSSHEPQTLGIHHSLAGYAKDYKKRAFVFKLITADWSVLYIQVKNQSEVKKWMDSINVSAAMLSSPPLPAPCGSAMTFQRPVMPVARSKLTLEEQLSHHLEKVKAIETDLTEHREYVPDTQSKHYADWENKLDYLEFEVKRFKAYLSVLTAVRLEPIRERILAAASNPEAEPLTQQSRSASVHNLVVPNSHTNKNSVMKERKDYYLESP